MYYQFCGESDETVSFYTTATRQPSQDVVHLSLWKRSVGSIILLLDYLFFFVKFSFKAMAQKVFLKPILKAWTQLSTIAHDQFISLPKEEACGIPRRKLPIILSQLERLVSLNQLTTLVYTSISGMKSTAHVIAQVNEYIHMVVGMINDVTNLFLGVFLNVRVVTKNIAFALSLIDCFTQSIAMLQYFVAVFIYGFSFISSFLAKLRQNPT